MKLHLAPSLLHRMADHARQVYPYECCGLLLGSGQNHAGWRITRAEPTANASAADGRPDHYLIDPADHLRISREARHQRLQIIGAYHSHPDATCRPSKTDLAEAWPNFLYLILAVSADQLTDWACWRLKDQPGDDPAEAFEKLTHQPSR